MVGHDLIRCHECGLLVPACDICFARHECAALDRERYLAGRLRAELDSGELLSDAARWLAKGGAGRFFEYACWRREAGARTFSSKSGTRC